MPLSDFCQNFVPIYVKFLLVCIVKQPIEKSKFHHVQLRLISLEHRKILIKLSYWIKMSWLKSWRTVFREFPFDPSRRTIYLFSRRCECIRENENVEGYHGWPEFEWKGELNLVEPAGWTKFLIIPMTSSLKDFLDLMKTQFGDKTREEMEEMLKSGMSMEQVSRLTELISHRSE